MFAARIALIVALGMVAVSAVADTRPPSIEADLRGEIDALPGAPPLRWTVVSHPEKSGLNEVILTAQGAGTQLRIELSIDLTSGAGEWHLTEGVVDAKEWIAAIARTLDLGDLAATGQIQISGRGTIKGGRPLGILQVNWRQGTVGNETGGWHLDGVSFEAELAFDSVANTVQTSRPATVAVDTITTARFGARKLTVTAQLRPDFKVAVESARIEIAGGEVVAAPSIISLTPLNVQFDLKITRIGLQDLVQFVQKAVLEATGRVDGEIRLGWNKADGLIIGPGKFVLSHGETADVTVAPSPGLITSGISPKLTQVLPALLPALKRIEMGEAPIRAELLDVSITPNGDEEGRIATVHLKGEPTDASLHAPVDMMVNYRGPLDMLLKLGAGTKVSYGVK
jgi:hypothetical protein